MSKLTSKQFWCDLGERAVTTAAGAAIAAIPTTAVTIGQVDWMTVAGTVALATVVSVVKNIATLDESGSSVLTPTVDTGAIVTPDTEGLTIQAETPATGEEDPETDSASETATAATAVATVAAAASAAAQPGVSA